MKQNTPTNQLLSNTVIEKYVGATSYARGRTYAKQNRVSQPLYDESNLMISGDVSGSSGRPYTVTIILRPYEPGGYVIEDSDCTCPMEFACKHVAALALIGRELIGDGLAEGEIASSDWERKLGVLENQTASSVDIQPLALLFAMVPVTQYGGLPYNQRQKVTGVKLAIRPAMLNPATKRWILNGMTWRNIGYSRQNISAIQLSWLKELWTLYSAAQTEYYYNDKYLFLDDFQSPLLNDLLRRGQEDLGVAYLNDGRDREPLMLAREPAHYGMVLGKNEQDDLEVMSELLIGEHAIPPERVGFIGNPAHMAYIWDGGGKDYQSSTIILTALTETVDTKAIEAIQKHQAIVIPKADVPRFLTNHYPKLAQKVQIHIPNTLDLTIPELHPPRLQLQLHHRGHAGGLDVGWSWIYQVGNDKFELPLRAGEKKDATVRQAVLEAELLRIVEQVCHQMPKLLIDEQSLAAMANLKGMEVVAFAQVLLPELKLLPEVEVLEHGQPQEFSEFTDKPTIEMGVKQTAGQATDWFDLTVTVKLDSEEVPFEELFLALASDEEFLVLASGHYFKLDHPELDRLRRLIEEARGLQDKPTDNLQLSPFQASLWNELMALGVITHQAEVWEKSVKGLMDLQYVPKVAVPKNLEAKLRPYQVEGYQWLNFLYEHNLGGILADDMGLGKTLQTIALLLRIKAQTAVKNRRPALIVAPTSVAANWASELERFAPSLKVAYMRTQSSGNNNLVEIAQNADVVISTYGLFRTNFESYQSIDWRALILDEAQFVKNYQSKSYQCARKINVPFKLALTGTPLENNLMELWSLLSVAAPGLFPSPKRFGDFYQKPIEKDGSKEVLAQLRRRVRPLMLRRSKDQVASELPPKIEQTLELELNTEHQKIYDLYLARERQRVLGLIGDMDKNRFMIFKSITTLRMLSLDARLVDAKKYQSVESTKLNGLFDTLEPVIGEGHRALIFSQFTSFLKLLRQELDKRGIPYLYLDGTTKNRAELLQEFKNSPTPLFLISLKAGGFGLNLTEADYCFLLDPWWNPAVEQQAIDRTHRIGQSKQVIVYRLIAKGTIEEKVMALKERKAKLFKSMMDDEAVFASAITADDIRGLFEG